MKIRLTFKCPDVVDDAVRDLDDSIVYDVKRACEKWIEFGEYLTVEIDTNTGTCTAIEAKRRI